MTFLEKYRLMMTMAPGDDGGAGGAAGNEGGDPGAEGGTPGDPGAGQPPERKSIRDNLQEGFDAARQAEPETRGQARPKARKQGSERLPGGADASGAAGADGGAQAVEPPASLPKEIRDAWGQTPPAIQQAFVKREQDMEKGVNELRSRYVDIDRVLSPHLPAIRQHGQTPAQAIDQLFGWMNALANNPRVAFPALLTSFGFRPEQIFGVAQAPQGEQPPAPTQEELAAAQQHIQQGGDVRQLPPELLQALEVMAQKLTGLESGFQSQNEQRTAELVNIWAKDKPHFPAVRQLMAQLIQSGAVPLKQGRVDLDGAYAMAIYAHPEVRTKVQEEQSAAAAKEAADKAEKEKAAQQAAADKARRASKSLIPGAPGSNVGASKAPKTSGKSVRESIADAIKEHSV